MRKRTPNKWLHIGGIKFSLAQLQLTTEQDQCGLGSHWCATKAEGYTLSSWEDSAQLHAFCIVFSVMHEMDSKIKAQYRAALQ